MTAPLLPLRSHEGALASRTSSFSLGGARAVSHSDARAGTPPPLLARCPAPPPVATPASRARAGGRSFSPRSSSRARSSSLAARPLARCWRRTTRPPASRTRSPPSRPRSGPSPRSPAPPPTRRLPTTRRGARGRPRNVAADAILLPCRSAASADEAEDARSGDANERCSRCFAGVGDVLVPKLLGAGLDPNDPVAAVRCLVAGVPSAIAAGLPIAALVDRCEPVVVDALEAARDAGDPNADAIAGSFAEILEPFGPIALELVGSTGEGEETDAGASGPEVARAHSDEAEGHPAAEGPEKKAPSGGNGKPKKTLVVPVDRPAIPEPRPRAPGHHGQFLRAAENADGASDSARVPALGAENADARDLGRGPAIEKVRGKTDAAAKAKAKAKARRRAGAIAGVSAFAVVATVTLALTARDAARWRARRALARAIDPESAANAA